MSRTGKILTRPYTMALFTLQDGFKAILHGVNTEGMGHIQNPKITLKDDGTQELTFTIPMYIRDKTGKLVENPSWFDIDYGSLITGMEKVKVIFGDVQFGENTSSSNTFDKISFSNEGERLSLEGGAFSIIEEDNITISSDNVNYTQVSDGSTELTAYLSARNDDFISNEVFEFLITKVNETHSEGILKCEVTCEGLAFNELGKNGRLLTLNSDLYTLESSACDTGFISLINPFSSYSGFSLNENDTDGYSLDLTFIDKTANATTRSIDSTSVEMPYINLSVDTSIQFVSGESYTLSFTSNVESENIKWKVFNREYNSLSLINSFTLKLTDEEVENYIYYIPITFYGFNEGTTPVLSNFKFILNKEIKSNINYWMDKVVEGTDWTYSVRMDWASQDGIILSQDYDEINDAERLTINEMREAQGLRRMDVIYEDEYVSAWDVDDSGKLIPLEEEDYKEKERTIDSSESNRYNITQDIAEKFEVNCRYKYYYDENLKILRKEIIFFNNFIKDKSPIDITYPYDTSEITRELDSTDIVTKLYVTDIDDDTNLKSGKITIIDTKANKSGEDYILNFDYLYSIGAITEDQRSEISKYEAAMHTINKKMSDLSNNIAIYQQVLELRKGSKESCDASLSECATQKEEAEKMLKSMTGDASYIVKIDGTNSVPYVVLANTDNQKKYITIRESGVLTDTVNVWSDNTLSSSTKLVIDTNLFEVTESYTKVYFISVPENTTSVYAQYNYKPALYYTNILNQYTTLYDKKLAEKQQLEKEIKDYNQKLESSQNELNTLKRSKTEKIRNFDNFLGPAIREGSWQDDDYNDYGQKKNATLKIAKNNNYTSDNTEVSFIYDEVCIDGEQLNYYEAGVERNKVYYPYINISNYLSYLKEYKEDLCLLYGKCWEKLTSIKIDFSDDGTAYTKDEDSQDITGITINGTTYVSWDYSKSYAVNDLVYYDNNIYKAIYANINKAPGYYCDYSIYRINSQLMPALYKVVTKTSDGSISSTKIIPVLMILEEGASSNEDGTINYELDLTDIKLNPILGTQKSTIDDDNNVVTETETLVGLLDSEIKNGSENNIMLYPRIDIKNLDIKVQNGTTEISPKIQYYIDSVESANTFEVYEDYSLLAQYSSILDDGTKTEDRYSISIKPYSIFIQGTKNLNYIVDYTISNASTSLYLDALKVSKENAYPKVSYTVKINAVNDELIEKLYTRLDQICYINDSDLKFDSVRGYISEITLNLDEPWTDEITIQNYKTKFEDLFSSIVAATEEMKSNSTSYNIAASAITSSGGISTLSLQQTIDSGTINYNFDKGTLTINEAEGIWGTSDDGVVAYRGGGISVASSKDEYGDWIWHTGITPKGINASLINAGQINTEKISIFAGDQSAFQLNSTGLYAFRKTDDTNYTDKEYVVHNGEGLFLVNAEGYTYTAEDGSVNTLEEKINRVEISWDGLIIRNVSNETVFNADNDGNLKITGTITATNGSIGDWLIGNGGLYYLKDNNVFYISPQGSGNDENVIYIRGETNTFTVDRYGMVKGTSAIFTQSLVANNATINGVPFEVVLDSLDISPGIYMTSLRGEIFKSDVNNEFYPTELRYTISIYGTGDDTIDLDDLKLQINETSDQDDWYDFGIRTTNTNYWQEIEVLDTEADTIAEWDDTIIYNYDEKVKFLGRYYKYISTNSDNTADLAGIYPSEYINSDDINLDYDNFNYYCFGEDDNGLVYLKIKPSIVFNEQNIGIRITYGDYISEEFNIYITYDGTSGNSVIVSASNYGWKGEQIQEELTATLMINGTAITPEEASQYYYVWFKTDSRYEQKEVYYDDSLSAADNICGKGKSTATILLSSSPETIRIGCTVTNNYTEYKKLIGLEE